MDINAGEIILGKNTIDGVGQEIVDYTEQIVDQIRSKSETLGHQEFVLGYKKFDENTLKRNC